MISTSGMAKPGARGSGSYASSSQYDAIARSYSPPRPPNDPVARAGETCELELRERRQRRRRADAARADELVPSERCVELRKKRFCRCAHVGLDVVDRMQTEDL